MKDLFQTKTKPIRSGVRQLRCLLIQGTEEWTKSGHRNVQLHMAGENIIQSGMTKLKFQKDAVKLKGQ